ncbi:metal-binding protein [Pseudomonas sp. HLS-6]|nr:metal-binding protein [Pseudomonas sp. HLS-6]
MYAAYLQPLNDRELGRLDDLLLKYGNDDAIQTLSELDGLFVALASSPSALMPSQWLPEISGGRKVKFKKEAEGEAYYALLLRHMNSIEQSLQDATDRFEPPFLGCSEGIGVADMIEDWCFGYMRGVQLAQWPELPIEQAVHLAAIELHGLEENLSKVEALTKEEHSASIEPIVVAARALNCYFLAQRAPEDGAS